MRRSECESIEVAEDCGGDAGGLKNFAGDIPNFGGGDGFHRGDAFFDGSVFAEVEILPGEIAHACAGGFERKESRAFEIGF